MTEDNLGLKHDTSCSCIIFSPQLTPMRSEGNSRTRESESVWSSACCCALFPSSPPSNSVMVVLMRKVVKDSQSSTCVKTPGVHSS